MLDARAALHEGVEPRRRLAPVAVAREVVGAQRVDRDQQERARAGRGARVSRRARAAEQAGGEHEPSHPAHPTSIAAAGKTGPSTQHLATGHAPSGPSGLVNTAQPLQMPTPQPIRVSSESQQSSSRSRARSAAACSIGSGPHASRRTSAGSRPARHSSSSAWDHVAAEAARAVVGRGERARAQRREVVELVQHAGRRGAVDQGQVRGARGRRAVHPCERLLDPHVEGHGADPAGQHHPGRTRAVERRPAEPERPDRAQGRAGRAPCQRARAAAHDLEQELEAAVGELAVDRERPRDGGREPVLAAQHEEARAAQRRQRLGRVDAEDGAVVAARAYRAQGAEEGAGVGGRSGHRRRS